MNSIIILILIAIIPIILIGLYIYKKDKEKEPILLLAKLLLGGVLSAVAVILLNLNLIKVFPIFSMNSLDMSISQLLIYSFICVSLIEEASKLFFLYKISYNHKEFNYTFDMVVYGVFISMGFALFENIEYVLINGYEIGLLRAITAVPLHACTGAFMGIFLSIAKQREILKLKDAKKYKIAALIIPVILHGMYDFCAFRNSLLIIMTVVIMFTTVTILNVNVHNKLDRKL